jgi:hypothetical protein
MRMLFGLTGLLVTIGVIVVLMSSRLDYDREAIRAGRTATDQAQQFSGRDTDGQPITRTVDLQPEHAGGRLQGLRVHSVTPGGGMQTHYGLQPGDLIERVGTQGGTLMNVREFGDDEMARLQVFEAYRYQQPLVVNRNGQQLTLPQPAAQPFAAPDAPPVDQRDSLQRQLDLIQRPPSH